MKKSEYKGWTKTPGGSAYLGGTIIVDLVLNSFLAKTHESIITELTHMNMSTVLIAALGFICLLVLFYFGAKFEMKFMEKHNPRAKECDRQYSTKQKVVADFIIPPVAIWTLAVVQWLTLNDSVATPNWRMVVATCIVSVLTLSYPFIQYTIVSHRSA